MNLSHTFLLVLLHFGTTSNIVLTQAYDQSLHDCKIVASQFRNTCVDGTGNYDSMFPASDFTAMATETHSCPKKPKCFDDAPGSYVQSGTCYWERKLCVTCRADTTSGDVYIRVQTNNMPDHCIKTSGAKPQHFDYEVKFNPKHDITNAGWRSDWTNQKQLNGTVCPIRKSYNTALMDLKESGEKDTGKAVAIAINGVAFQFANSIKEDPCYPITDSNEQPLDICLGHTQQSSDAGMYHYHNFSPCLNQTFLSDKTMSDCSENTTACSNSIVDWALSGYVFNAATGKEIIGVSKDGHVVYGPYDDNGNKWVATDVDACNGIFSSGDDDYFYAATQWHPYAVGCQGPSRKPTSVDTYPVCSKNGLDKYISVLP